jgi:hypothetical protein
MVGSVRIHSMFGQAFLTRLVVPCDEGEQIEQSQREDFIKFDAQKEDLIDKAEAAIFDYYLGIVDEYRERVGAEFADRTAPEIDEISQLRTLIDPTETIIQQSFGEDERIVGLLFDCSWDPSLGLAVKFVNERLDEVGVQDIVL